MRVAAIIVAGGRGERLGGDVPKQLIHVAGRQVLEHSVEAFAACALVDEIVVVLPSDYWRDPPSYLAGRVPPIIVAEGGARRQDSVANGVKALREPADIVVLHDAVRPFVTPALIERTVGAAAETGAAIAAIAAHDTVKLGKDGFVQRTMPRESVFLAQTPQAFRWNVLRDALELGSAGAEATDEAFLAEQAGHRVRLVEGEKRNLKITTPEDLAFARGLAMNEPEPIAIRVGIGYDLHRLVRGRPLILGGVTVPFEFGAAGHSDADALCHAVTDAVLGAAGAGDIGRHFPDSDETWRGASSLELLERAVRIVSDRGFRVVNVDAVVMLEKPRLAPHVETMAERLGAVLGVDPGAVSLKGKTGEGIGEIGRGEAVAAHAVAILEKRC